MVYFHLLRMLIVSLGRGRSEMGNTIHTVISAPDTRLRVTRTCQLSCRQRVREMERGAALCSGLWCMKFVLRDINI